MVQATLNRGESVANIGEGNVVKILLALAISACYIEPTSKGACEKRQKRQKP
jgi:hypothetical protein